MKGNKIVKIVVIALIATAIVISAGIGFVIFDVTSYTATGNTTLDPNGQSVGHALVAYDPGVSGGAKNAAGKIANDLQSKGYLVELAGVSSSKASNTSVYDVIVVVGPTYWDSFASAVRSYLQNLNVSLDTKIGVVATGIVWPQSNNTMDLVKNLTGLPDGPHCKVKTAMKLVTDLFGNNADKTESFDDKCSGFVTSLLH
jgi:flavodoxin